MLNPMPAAQVIHPMVDQSILVPITFTTVMADNCFGVRCRFPTPITDTAGAFAVIAFYINGEWPIVDPARFINGKYTLT
jgi:hypothetical protein